MTVKFLLDVNLSPDWVTVLERRGWKAVHWSTVGDLRASDQTIMDWAATHGYAVFTHDLDFSRMLALSHATGPSVFQIRTPDILPDRLERAVVTAIEQHEFDLSAGALVVLDAHRSRLRVLPI